ncbi:hypothetical protein EGJ28_15895 [Stutzerimonas xanthomarina]|jgi:hypothetical protein|uniref:Uncharacterized protein n=1 Tax=Stutzerimonas xanthomarina TaxID=271420 RepID=A0A427DYB1_9GAMM|nr:hypothetical protein [Stutzerimonas xanthomarina]RRV08754.1 hypothetical protein EGJ28_15895 [Stutzerimonas xanthomarina]
MFVLNQNGHYFEIDTQTLSFAKDDLQNCRIFDEETALLEEVCRRDGLEVEDIAGSTFFITVKNGTPVMIDDRCITHSIDTSVEMFVSEFAL